MVAKRRVGWPARFWRWVRVAIRNALQRVAGTYHEGPDPPVRLAQAVEAFISMRPHATTQDWASFAAGHAAEAYRSGYLRGVEWQARSPRSADLAQRATAHEMAERHGWSWVDLAPAEDQLAAIVQNDPGIVERLSPEERVLYMDRIGQEMGGFRVELFPEDEKCRSLNSKGE